MWGRSLLFFMYTIARWKRGFLFLGFAVVCVSVVDGPAYAQTQQQTSEAPKQETKKSPKRRTRKRSIFKRKPQERRLCPCPPEPSADATPSAADPATQARSEDTRVDAAEPATQVSATAGESQVALGLDESPSDKSEPSPQPLEETPSDTANLEVSGKLVNWTRFPVWKSSLLNPSGTVMGNPSVLNQTYAIAQLRWWTPARLLELSIKDRPGISYVQGDGSTPVEQNSIDEFKAVLKPSTHFFLTAGKSDYRDGSGLSANPTDFLGEPYGQYYPDRAPQYHRALDRAKAEEERREERPGSYLASAEFLFSGWGIYAAYAPKLAPVQDEAGRLYARLHLILKGAEINLSGITGARPGVGINLAKVFGDALGVNAELALRSKGRLPRIEGTMDDTVFVFNQDTEQRWRAVALAGINLTYLSTNLILEYYFDGTGWGTAEYVHFLNSLRANGATYETAPEPHKSSLRGLLLTSASLLQYGTLRHNYVFARLSRNIVESLEASIVGLVNIDAGPSEMFRVTLQYAPTNYLQLRAVGTAFAGSKLSEFGLVPQSAEAAGVAAWYF